MNNYPPTITPRKKRSAVWRYFSKITLRENLCKLCGSVVTAARYSTGGMIYHLRSRHYPEFCEIMDILRLKAGSQSFNGPVRYNRNQFVVSPPSPAAAASKQSKYDINKAKPYVVHKRTPSNPTRDELDEEQVAYEDDDDIDDDVDDEDAVGSEVANDSADRVTGAFETEEQNASASGINGVNINGEVDHEDSADCDVINANDDYECASSAVSGSDEYRYGEMYGDGDCGYDKPRFARACRTNGHAGANGRTALRVEADDAQWAQSSPVIKEECDSGSVWHARKQTHKHEAVPRGGVAKRRRLATRDEPKQRVTLQLGVDQLMLASRLAHSEHDLVHSDSHGADDEHSNAAVRNAARSTVIRELSEAQLRRLAPLCNKSPASSVPSSTALLKFDALKCFYTSQSGSRSALGATSGLPSLRITSNGEPFILVENRETAKSSVPNNCIQKITSVPPTVHNVAKVTGDEPVSSSDDGGKSRVVFTVFPDLSVKASSERSVAPTLNFIESSNADDDVCADLPAHLRMQRTKIVIHSSSASAPAPPPTATQSLLMGRTRTRKRKGTPTFLRSSPLANGVSTTDLAPAIEEPIKIEPREPDELPVCFAASSDGEHERDADDASAAVRRASEEEYEDDSPRFCICRTKRIFGFMIVCSECLNWYHVTCAGFSHQSVNSVKRYVCAACSERDPSLSTVLVQRNFEAH